MTTNQVVLPNGTLGFAGNYTGAYTRGITDSFVGNYRSLTSLVNTLDGQLCTWITGEYTGTYSRDFGGEYTGTYSRDFVGEYVGNFSRDFVGSTLEHIYWSTREDLCEDFDSSNQDGVNVPSGSIGFGVIILLKVWVYPTTSGGTRMIGDS